MVVKGRTVYQRLRGLIPLFSFFIKPTMPRRFNAATNQHSHPCHAPYTLRSNKCMESYNDNFLLFPSMQFQTKICQIICFSFYHLQNQSWIFQSVDESRLDLHSLKTSATSELGQCCTFQLSTNWEE